MNKSRPNQFLFRLSDSERELFLNKVARSGLSQQNFIKKCVLDKPVISLDRAEMHRILVELSRQGNNLNQIARVVNEGGYLADQKTILEMKEELENIWQQLKLLVHMQA